VEISSQRSNHARLEKIDFEPIGEHFMDFDFQSCVMD